MVIMASGIACGRVRTTTAIVLRKQGRIVCEAGLRIES